MTKPPVSLQDVQAFLFDMDGTLTMGDHLIEGARELIQYLAETNRYYALVTNNSSKSAFNYAEKLLRAGLRIDTDRITTSSHATIHYLRRQNPEARLFVVGTPTFERDLREAGFKLVPDDSDTVDFVVIGFDTTVTYEKLARATQHVLNGARLVGSNPDLRCPVPGGYIPDCGALTQVVELAAGAKAEFLGKPERGILEAALAGPGIPLERTAFVGDRLYTDILGANRHGLTSILVLSGEAKLEDLVEAQVCPNHVYVSVKELLHDLKRLDLERCC